ncbi:MAG: MFS transporter [Brevirhabdus sp.]
MSMFAAIRLSRHTLPAFAVEGMFWGAYAALVPVIKDGIGASDATYGTAMLFSAVGAVLAMWFAPRFAGTAGRAAMGLAALALAISFQGPAWVSSLLFFTIAIMLAGAMSGLLDVVMNARLSGIEARARMSLMNLNHAFFSLAYAISAMATGLAREAGAGPQAVFFALLLVTLVLAALSWEPRSRDTAPADGQKQTRRLPLAVYICGGIILIAFMSENAVEGWSALHVERTLGGGATEGASGPAVLGVTMFVGRLSGQFVVARLRPGGVLVAAALVSAFGALIAAGAVAPWMAYLGFGVLGLGVSVIAPMAFALIGPALADDDRAQGISRAAVVGYLGFFIGPPVMGFVAEATTLRLSFVAMALALGLVPLLEWLLRRSGR